MNPEQRQKIENLIDHIAEECEQRDFTLDDVRQLCRNISSYLQKKIIEQGQKTPFKTSK